MKTRTAYNLTPKAYERFWSFVDKTSDGCWEWAGWTHGKGYGRFTFLEEGKQRFVSTHRVSYFLEYGTIPERLFVLHRCDNLPCVRPTHLFLGTHTDNMRDKAQKRSLLGLLSFFLVLEKVGPVPPYFVGGNVVPPYLFLIISPVV